jgi:putative sterol carrier protein
MIDPIYRIFSYKVNDKISFNIDILKKKICELLENWNQSEVILDEIADWEKAVLFELNNKHQFYISSNGSELRYHDTHEKQADCIIKINSEDVMKFFNQELNLFEVLVNEDIEFEGDSAHFFKISILFEYFKEDKDLSLLKTEDDWQVGVPEDYGMSNSLLDEVAKKLKIIDINRNSLIVIKNGVLIYETYYGKKSAEKRKWMHYDVASVTKTLGSLVVGTAVTQGLITVKDYILIGSLMCPKG